MPVCPRIKFQIEFHIIKIIVGSVAQWLGAPIFYHDHDCKVNGSTSSLVSLLRPWMRCFAMIISTWWNPANSKLKKSEAKFNRKTRKQRQLLSESEFVLSIAPPPLSRDRRRKMKKSINHFTIMYNYSKGVPYKRFEKLSCEFYG